MDTAATRGSLLLGSVSPPQLLAASPTTAHKRTPSPLERIVSASFGAVVTSLLVTPFDVVKTRMQSAKAVVMPGLDPSSIVRNGTGICRPPVSSRYFLLDNDVLSGCRRASSSLTPCWTPCGSVFESASVGHCSAINSSSSTMILPLRSTTSRGTMWYMLSIFRNDGVGALWRGLTPTLIMSIPSTAIYLIGYDLLRERLGTSLSFVGAESYSPLLAGAFARIVSATVISPIELIRTRMQAGNNGMLDIIGGISRNVALGGPRSLFRGLLPTLWRDVPFSAIYWVGYENIKKRVAILDDQGYVANELAASFTSGSISGMISAIVTHPFDVIKTLQQVSHTAETTAPSIISSFKGVLLQSGWRGLFTGVVPRVVKVAPACGIMISSYEFGKRILSGTLS
ncbi:hypothetical protein BASA81_008959 [Batrachochytrium salamandrivorans]|nr:hypothetical protein BASA81_008959 [Batrachochytrium salamandrivorans]